MLRKGLVALMMGVICAGSAAGDEPAQKPAGKAPAGVFGWFRSRTNAPSPGKSSAGGKKSAHADSMASTGKASFKAAAGRGIERAVVSDAEKQSVDIRQTSAKPQDKAPELEFPQFAPAVPEQPAVVTAPAAEVKPAESGLKPVTIQQVPQIPNNTQVRGPQYFSATPAGKSNPIPVHPGGNWQTYQAPAPVHQVSAGTYWNASDYSATGPVYHSEGPVSPQYGGMYPQTGAALYPAPVPGIPQQIGGTAIMNQAFHPHEYLYPHRYSAMYPPYYYKVNGGWMVTPFGVWSQENWKLQGTRVDVQYKSHISPFSGFHPPVIR